MYNSRFWGTRKGVMKVLWPHNHTPSWTNGYLWIINSWICPQILSFYTENPGEEPETPFMTGKKARGSFCRLDILCFHACEVDGNSLCWNVFYILKIFNVAGFAWFLKEGKIWRMLLKKRIHCSGNLLWAGLFSTRQRGHTILANLFPGFLSSDLWAYLQLSLQR